MNPNGPILPFERSHAFIIGINAYQYITPLETAVNDAKGIAERLKNHHGYEIHGPYLDATRTDLMRIFTETMPNEIGEKDRVVFYFAGHGVALDGDDGPNGYLVPADAKPGVRESLVPMNELHITLNELPCRHGLLILDCCFSGAFKWSTGFRSFTFDEISILYEERFWRYVKDPAWQVITSSAHDQKAVDVLDQQSLGLRDEGDGRHSPFAYALFDALEGSGDVVPADGGDGVMTASELYAYLRHIVEDQTNAHAMRQSPSMFELAKHDKGEYIFLSPRHRFNLPPRPDRNPFMGLASYDEADSNFFFGRGRVIDALYERVNQKQLTVVSGASGTGKSSVIKAGLLPKLRKEDWELLPVIRPGKEPMQVIQDELPNMDQALAKDKKLLLIVDQYEELISQTLKEEDREAFEDQLAQWLSTHSNLRIILSVRSDFEPQFESKALAPWWSAGRYVVPAFSLEEIREVIVQPAVQSVLFYEPRELVDRLEEDVSQAPGALPLLSFTLSELYYAYLKSGREDRALTLEDYENMGGVIGALRTKADEVYLKQDQAHQDSMRKLMLRLVSLEGGELASKRVYADELIFSNAEETKRIEKVATELVDARLVRRGKDQQDHIFQEPAHDALVRAWGRLWEWIKATGEEKLVWQNKLSQAVVDYHNLLEQGSPKARNLLWNNNPRLDILKAELEGKNHTLNAQEEAFVRESVVRKKVRQRQLIGSLVGVIVALSGLTTFAFTEKSRADSNRIEADSNAVLATRRADTAIQARIEADSNLQVALWERDRADSMTGVAEKERDNAILQARISKANELVAQARQMADEDLTIALNLAYAAFHTHRSKEATAALYDLNLLRTQEGFYKSFSVHSESVESVAFSPDGKHILTGSLDETAKLWDLQGNEVKCFRGHSGSVVSVAFSPDGQHILTGSWDETAKLWDLQGNEVKCFRGHSEGLTAVTFSPDGKRILTGSFDKTVKLWDLQSNEVKSFSGHNGAVWSVAFSPNGKYILTGSYDSTAKLWDHKGNKVQSFNRHTEPVLSVAFSPDGQHILTGSRDNNAKLWDLQGNEVESFSGHSGDVLSVAFSPDGKQILTGGGDKTAKLWDLQGNELQNFRGHSRSVLSVAFSPNGNQILSGSYDKTVKLWDLQDNELQSFKGHSGYVLSVAFSPDGKQILTRSSDYGPTSTGSGAQTAKLWDLQDNKVQSLSGPPGDLWFVTFSPNGKQILTWNSDRTAKRWGLQGNKVQSLSGHSGDVLSVAFSPNGKHILTGSSDSTAKLWDNKGNEVQSLSGHSGDVFSVAFSPDGQHILTGSFDHTAKLWDLKGNVVQSLIGHSGDVLSVAFSPDGKYILTGSEDNTAKLWDLQGTEVQSFSGHGDQVLSVAFSPNGKQILTGSKDDTAKLWDLQGNELQSFSGHNGDVLSIAFSPNGQQILTGSMDETAKLWDASLKFDDRIYKLNAEERKEYGILEDVVYWKE